LIPDVRQIEVPLRVHHGNKGGSYLDLFPHLFLDCFKFNSEPKKRGRPTGEQDPSHKLVKDTWLTLEKSKFQKEEYAVFVIVLILLPILTIYFPLGTTIRSLLMMRRTWSSKTP
jgi:hypothetical protein